MGRIAGKKRKGFHGKRPAELARESLNVPATPMTNNSPTTAAAVTNRERPNVLHLGKRILAD